MAQTFGWFPMEGLNYRIWPVAKPGQERSGECATITVVLVDHRKKNVTIKVAGKMWETIAVQPHSTITFEEAANFEWEQRPFG